MCKNVCVLVSLMRESVRDHTSHTNHHPDLHTSRPTRVLYFNPPRAGAGARVRGDSLAGRAAAAAARGSREKTRLERGESGRYTHTARLFKVENVSHQHEYSQARFFTPCECLCRHVCF